MKYVANYFDGKGIQRYDESNYIAMLKINAKNDGAEEVEISKKEGIWKTYGLNK